jgi:PAS domain-containing protein
VRAGTRAELGETVVHAIRAAETRERLAAQYRDLFADAPVTHAVTDTGTASVIEGCNRLFVERLGHDGEAVLGRPLGTSTRPSRPPNCSPAAATSALEAAFTSEERHLRASDDRVVETLLRAVPRLDEIGAVVGTLALSVAVAEQRSPKEAWLAGRLGRSRSTVRLTPASMFARQTASAFRARPG